MIGKKMHVKPEKGRTDLYQLTSNMSENRKPPVRVVRLKIASKAKRILFGTMKIKKDLTAEYT